MNTQIKVSLLLFIFFNIISCGESQPTISHMVVKNDRQGTLLDTENQSELKILAKVFNEKIEAPNAGPEFRYLIDITTSDVTVRWQYSIDGYIRNYEESNSMIYKLKDIALFNRTTLIATN
jgi:hypothetical protein